MAPWKQQLKQFKQGAFDYLPKPIALERLRQVVSNAMGERQLVAVSQHNEIAADGSIIGSTPAMQEVYTAVWPPPPQVMLASW